MEVKEDELKLLSSMQKRKTFIIGDLETLTFNMLITLSALLCTSDEFCMLGVLGELERICISDIFFLNFYVFCRFFIFHSL